MAQEPENLILIYLRRIEEKLDRTTQDVGEIKERLTLHDDQFSLLHRDNALLHARVDRIEQRLDRIERRLDLVPAD